MKKLLAILLLLLSINSLGQRTMFGGQNNYVGPVVTPTIVTTNLILHLDPANYSGSGTTWNDLSSQNNTVTLVSNPAYSSNPPSFTFAPNKYGLSSNLISSFTSATFITWVNPSQIQGNYTGIIFSRSPNSGATNPATRLNFYTNNSIGYSWNDNPSSYNWDSGLQAAVGAWAMIVVTINSTSATAYLFNSTNPAGLSRTNTVSHPSLTGLKFYIGAEPFDLNTRAFVGKIGTTMVYNSALTQADIINIYNAQKSTYGL